MLTYSTWDHWKWLLVKMVTAWFDWRPAPAALISFGLTISISSLSTILILNVEIFLEFFNFNLLKSKQNKSLIDSWISARLSPTHAQPRLNSNILIFRGLNEERKSKHLKIKTSEFSLDWARALIQLSSSKHELTTWDSGSLTWTQKQ